MPDSATGNTAPALTAVAVLLFVWSLCAYFVRLYVKLSQSDGWKPDDWAITGAAVAALGQLVAICYSVHRGYGTPWETMSPGDQHVVEQSLFASQILYVASVGAAKISAACFITSVLARDKTNVLISKILTGLCGAWTVASIVAIAIRGDIAAPWDTRNGSQILYVRWVGIEGAGFALDLAAAVVIAYFVYYLQMKAAKKITVFLILNCRLVLVVPVAFRLYYLHPPTIQKVTITAETIRQVIIGCNIIFSALSCLKPFLKPFDAATFGSHGSRSGLFRYTANQDKSATYYELSANQATNRSMGSTAGAGVNRKNNVVQSQRSVEEGEDDELPLTIHAAAPRLRPGVAEHTTDIRHSEQGNHRQGRNISKTQTWDVRVG